MSDPTVSIIVPVSERTHRLPEALKSIFAQTFPSFEIIVTISPTLLTEELKKDVSSHRLRYIVADGDVTTGMLLLLGERASRGRYIGILAADDVYDPYKIDLQVQALAQCSGPGVAICATEIGERESVTNRSTLNEQAIWSTILLLSEKKADPRTLLFDRSCLDIVGSFNPAYDSVPEFELALRLAARFPFVFLPGNLVEHRLPPFQPLQYPLREYERQRACIRLLEAPGTFMVDLGAQSLIAFGQLLKTLDGNDLGAALRPLKFRIAETVGPDDLTIALFSESGKPDLDCDCSEIAKRLGVPRACCVSLQGTSENQSALVFEALAITRTDRLLLADIASLPVSLVLLRQLLNAAADDLDACLPVTDSLVYEETASASMLTGTLFRRTALESSADALLTGESEFWAKFGTIGRIGGLPSSRNVARPGRKAFNNTSFDDVQSFDQAMSVPALAAALVDCDWYRMKNPEIAEAQLDPEGHYQRSGWKEGKDPNPWFSTAWHVLQSEDGEQLSPLEHFVQNGVMAVRCARPGFNLRWYIRRYMGTSTQTPEAVLSFLAPDLCSFANPDDLYDLSRLEVLAPQLVKLSRRVQIDPRADSHLLRDLVDQDWYLGSYPDVAQDKMVPETHFLDFGMKELRDPSAWFNTAWYLAHETTAELDSKMTPIEHFVLRGARSGFRPQPGFDLSWYSLRYLGQPPSAEALLHFQLVGLRIAAVTDPRLDRREIRERLKGTPYDARVALLQNLQKNLASDDQLLAGLIDPDWYLDAYRDVAQDGMQPQEHFLNFGVKELRDPNPWFLGEWYRQQFPQLIDTGLQTIEHFIKRGASAGYNPGLIFDTKWYSQRFLGADSPSAEALVHFITVGLKAGAVPNVDMDGESFRQDLMACPVERRTKLIFQKHAQLRIEEGLIRVLVQADWYRLQYFPGQGELLDEVEDYCQRGWKQDRNPNPWFDSQWYRSQNYGYEADEICPLEHFVRVGAAEGRNPHPSFDTTWYSNRYLGNPNPDPESLKHFLTVGLATGAVPNQRLDSMSVHNYLLSMPPSQRSQVLQQIEPFLSDESSTDRQWQAEHADLWPLLLKRNFPAGVLPVLLICGHDPELYRAEASALSLPPDEFPLFAVMVEEDFKLRLTDGLNATNVSVTFELPEQLAALKELLTSLHCKRAAPVSVDIQDSSAVRFVRSAGVPVFANGRRSAYT